jgi:hypothetical protein
MCVCVHILNLIFKNMHVYIKNYLSLIYMKIMMLETHVPIDFYIFLYALIQEHVVPTI